MIRLLVILSLVATTYAQSFTNPVPVKVNTYVTWDKNPSTDGDITYLYSVVGAKTNFTGETRGTNFIITNVVWNWPNDVYKVTIVASNLSTMVSDPSEPVYLLWYGRPARVTGIRFLFTNAIPFSPPPLTTNRVTNAISPFSIRTN